MQTFYNYSQIFAGRLDRAQRTPRNHDIHFWLKFLTFFQSLLSYNYVKILRCWLNLTMTSWIYVEHSDILARMEQMHVNVLTSSKQLFKKILFKDSFCKKNYYNESSYEPHSILPYTTKFLNMKEDIEFSLRKTEKK